MRRIEVNVGTRFGKLVVLEEVFGVVPRIFKLQCDCGKIKDVRLESLRAKGGTKSCGCLRDGRRGILREVMFPVKRGEVFGRCTIVGEMPRVPGKARKVEVVCSCGILKVVSFLELRSGRTLSCGCLAREKAALIKDSLQPGERFGRLEVIREVSPRRTPLGRIRRYFLMQCDCGVTKEVCSIHLKSGDSKSCGCLRREINSEMRLKTFSKKGGIFGDWTVLEGRKSFPIRSGSYRVLCQCACGRERLVLPSNLQRGSSLSCGHSYRVSKGELDLLLFTRGLGVGVVDSGNRDILEGKEIDIFIPSENLGLEYNGNHWHSEKFRKDKMYHLNKRLQAEAKGVRLIQIRSDEWLYKRPIVESLLKAVLKKSENRYFARKLTIAEVPVKQAQKFLQENHLMGGYRSSRHLGLFTPEGTLAQLFSFKLLKDQTEMDCSRICSLRNHSIVGGVSRLLKAALRKHPSVQRVISFVDLRYAEGHSLEKIGFVREKVTLGWGWTDGWNWFNRLQCKADPKRGLTERENAALKGWYRIYDAGQAKYVMEVTR